MIKELAQRARLQMITTRAAQLDKLHEMLEGGYTPTNGSFLPEFRPGTSRHKAFQRAVQNVDPPVPVIINRSLDGLGLSSITWSDPDGDAQATAVNDTLSALPLGNLARELAIEYLLSGVCVAMASTPTVDGVTAEPTISVLKGINLPYTDPIDPGRITGWFRSIQHVNKDGKLVWWSEAFEFHANGTATHRVWRNLSDPTNLGNTPDAEVTSTSRPRFALNGLQQDGLPLSRMLANLGRIQGLYATELRLATTEEVSSFPMLFVKGNPEYNEIGPAEVITADADGDARWMEPGNLEQLRDQVTLRREAVREAFNLPGGALGGQTPSGEALAEANRGFIQASDALAGVLSQVLTEVTTDYLALHGLPPVTVEVPIDRAWLTEQLVTMTERGVDLGVVPHSVAARVFQGVIGNAYSDEELEAFLEERAARQAVHSFLTTQEVPRDNQ